MLLFGSCSWNRPGRDRSTEADRHRTEIPPNCPERLLTEITPLLPGLQKTDRCRTTIHVHPAVAINIATSIVIAVVIMTGNGTVTGIGIVVIGTETEVANGDAMTIIEMIEVIDRSDTVIRKTAIVPIGIETIEIGTTAEAVDGIAAEVEVAIAGEKVVHDHAIVIGMDHVPVREALIPRIVNAIEEIFRLK